MSKVIIAGTRTVKNMQIVALAIMESGYDITEVVSGGALGVDRLGETWAKANDIPIRQFLPDWGQGKKGGPIRNEAMATYADALIAIWNGQSKGTKDMIRRAQKKGLRVYVFDYGTLA